MSSVEWVEVRGKDVDVAVAAAVEELGLPGPEAAEVEVLQEPQRGFLGMGGQDAIVRVKPKKSKGRRRSSRSRDRKSGSGKKNGKRAGGNGSARKSGNGKAEGKPRNDRSPRTESAAAPKPKAEKQAKKKKEPKVDAEVDRQAQAQLVKEFLSGLLDAFGLDGEVDCRVEDDIILADVSGEQTEALVGPKGAILQGILELSRTVVQRKSQAGARIRLDIAGYTERRRQALKIYTGRLVERVVAEGGEIMLEPMNAADRKVVHDAAAELGGVRTYSEGEDPYRSVVIAKDDS